MKKILLLLTICCAYSLNLMAQGHNIGEVLKLNGEIVVDGEIDEVWDDANVFNILSTPLSTHDNASDDLTSGTVKSFLSPTTLYVLIEVQDKLLSKDSPKGMVWGNTDDAFDFPVGFGNVDADTDAGMAEFLWITVGVEHGENNDTTGTTVMAQQNNYGKALAAVNTADSVPYGAQKIIANYGYNIEVAIPLLHLDSTAAVDGEDFSGRTMLFDVRHNDSDGTPEIPAPDWAPEGSTGRDGQWTLGSVFTIKEGAWWTIPVSSSRVTISSDVVDVPSTGLISRSATTFDVYPNPASGTVRIKNAEPGSEISILNLAGQTVVSTEVNGFNMELNISELNAGIYFVRVSDSAQKLVIE